MSKRALTASMSRRSICYENAVGESFFQLIKREHIRRKSISTERKKIGVCSTKSNFSTTRNAVAVMQTAFLR